METNLQKKALFPLVIVLISCANVQYKTSEEYLRYIENQENGLKISKFYSDIELTAKFLPAELKALQELETGYGFEVFDSLLLYYSGSYNFIFTISPTKNNRIDDLNYYGIYNYDEFVERKKNLNYNFEECFVLQAGNKEYYPALFHFEQDYCVSGKLVFHLVFVTSEKTKRFEKITLQFNDPFYNTNQSNFIFKGKSLKKIPTVKF